MPIKLLKPVPLFSMAAVLLIIGGVLVGSQMNQAPAEPTAQQEPDPSPAPSPPSEPEPVAVPEIPDDWQTYRNDEFGFEVRYPQGYEVLGTGFPGEPVEGKETSPGYIFLRTKGEYWGGKPYIMISTPLTNDFSRNPRATTLDNYQFDYKSEYFDVTIHSQEEMVIKNVPVLKQNYSAGEWRDDGTFDATSEYAENMSYRYIFVDESGDFFILKSWNPAAKPTPSEADKSLSVEFENLLDDIVQTFRFIE